jgi:hypothetical protein
LNGVENQVCSDDGTAKTRGEAGPFAPDEGEPGELIELLVDPGENLSAASGLRCSIYE